MNNNAELLPKHFPSKPSMDELQDAVHRSLENAEKAIAVLSTMLKVAGLKQGYAVADEMLGDIKYALQALLVIFTRSNAKAGEVDESMIERAWAALDAMTLLDPTTIELAIAIADDAARSDIECLTLEDADSHGRPLFDLSCAPWGGDQSDLEMAQRAARYIEQRGDALPYIMHREGDVVRFEIRV